MVRIPQTQDSGTGVRTCKLEIECLKLDAQKPIYCVALGWSSEFVCRGEDLDSLELFQGEDLDSLELFQTEEEALAYKAKLEASESFDDGWGNYVEIIQKFVNQK